MKIPHKHKSLGLIAVLYMAMLIWLLFFFEAGHFSRLDPKHHFELNLIPFHNIRHMWEMFVRYQGEAGTARHLFFNIAGNLFLLSPLAIIIRLLYPTMRFHYLILIIFMSSLCIESTQYMTQRGSADIDDVILNTLGGSLMGVLYSCKNKNKL